MAARRGRPPPPTPLLDLKAWFLGRFVSETFDERAHARLRANIRLTKGSRTRLRLTECGLSDCNKSRGFGSFRDRSKNVDTSNFSALRDIISIEQDSVYNNVLLCVSDYGVSQLEILAYRMRSDTAVTSFHDAFVALSSNENNGSNNGDKDESPDGATPGKVASMNGVPARQRNWFLLPDESRLCTLRSVPEHVDISYPYRFRNRTVSADRTPDEEVPIEMNDKSINDKAKCRANHVGDHVARPSRRPSHDAASRVCFGTVDASDDGASEPAGKMKGGDSMLSSSDSLRTTMRRLSDQVQDIKVMLLSGKEKGKVNGAATVHVNGYDRRSDSFASLTSLQKAIMRDSIRNVAGTVKIVVDDYRMRKLCDSMLSPPKLGMEPGYPSVTCRHSWASRVAAARGSSEVSKRPRARSAHDLERIAYTSNYKKRSRSLEHHSRSAEVDDTHAHTVGRHDDSEVVFTLHPSYALQAGDSTIRLVRSPRSGTMSW